MRFGPPYSSPHGQSATFVELFFDLVFVFAVTEVTARTVEHLDWAGVARSLLIFWLIWWGWTQWTWALNAADTEHSLVRLATLLATAVAFIMAASVGIAFDHGGGGLWFALPYVLVRVLGLGLYWIVTVEHAVQHAAIPYFAFPSIAGLVLVAVGGAVDPSIRPWLWMGAIIADVVAAMVAGRAEDWGLHPEHFAERHGLFVIIALGESLIVVGSIVAGAERSPDLAVVAIGAVVVTALLWWTYFGWLKNGLEAQLGGEPHAREASIARDVYSLLHFPLVGGVIGVAAAFELIAHHPDRHPERGALLALAAGLALFVGAAALAWTRASGKILVPRIAVLVVLMLGLALTANAHPGVSLALVAIALGAIAGAEARHIPGATPG